NKDFINFVLKKERNLSPVTNILLGNSASRENNHLDALDFLSKFADDNIKIYCPLSYGDTEEYKKEVIEKGTSILKNKFEPVIKFMPSEEYADFFSKMNVAIFNNNRQQAMGNITLASFLGCKVYLKQNTTMWRQYVEIGGCHFYPVERISELNIDDFKFIDDESIDTNKKYFEKLQDRDFMKKTWDPLLYQNCIR
ncbi:MAG: TDP-N-acetylfucosamine:lipid II N-acetylfucosaminyltransferase, partial [Treponema sp.]|nr:TDP-N-acetylfucosamine:lipid II N-acetylfucosaminyltransferase [Treponema sp.]